MEDLLDKLLKGLKVEVDIKFWEDPLVDQVGKEIKANQQALTDSVQSAEWDFQDNEGGAFGDEDTIGRKRFFYDREKGGKGDYQEMLYRKHDKDEEYDYDEEEEE